jgi:hypothetical protein
MIVANMTFIKLVGLIDLIGSLQLFKQISVAPNLEPDHTPVFFRIGFIAGAGDFNGVIRHGHLLIDRETRPSR